MKKEWSQEELAGKIGIQSATYLAYISKEEIMDVETFFKIVEELEIPLSVFQKDKKEDIRKTKERNEEDIVDEEIERYLEQINKFKKFSEEEEKELLQELLDGDEQVKRKLAESYLKFVYNIAEGYQKRGMRLMDLIHEGNLGLLKALEQFNGGKHHPFSKYVAWWVKQAIVRAISEQSKIVRIPTNFTVSLTFKIKTALRQLKEALKREPSTKELAEYLGIDEEKLKNILKHFPKE